LAYNTIMETAVEKRLLELNFQFYQSFADDFSATRERLQPGVEKLLSSIPPGSRILDLGCGNGNIIRALAIRGFKGFYLGADFSPGLLEHAPREQAQGLESVFIQLDLTSERWEGELPREPFDYALCFAVLHHIPGHQARLGVCRKLGYLLQESGRLFLSNWQFLNSSRLRKRIVPWEKAGVAKADLDAGDYLLDWKRGGLGLRYVHLFSGEELDALAEESGFQVLESFLSDGKEGNLGLYQAWELS
jgi:tRNA (uracil-5-)-methyltransferase TRM9